MIAAIRQKGNVYDEMSPCFIFVPAAHVKFIIFLFNSFRFI